VNPLETTTEMELELPALGVIDRFLTQFEVMCRENEVFVP